MNKIENIITGPFFEVLNNTCVSNSYYEKSKFLFGSTNRSKTNRSFAFLPCLRGHGVYEIADTPTPSLGFQTTIETFRMRYCMMFYLKGLKG